MLPWLNLDLFVDIVIFLHLVIELGLLGKIWVDLMSGGICLMHILVDCLPFKLVVIFHFCHVELEQFFGSLFDCSNICPQHCDNIYYNQLRFIIN